MPLRHLALLQRSQYLCVWICFIISSSQFSSISQKPSISNPSSSPVSTSKGFTGTENDFLPNTQQHMSKCKSTISPLIILCIQMVAAEKLKKHSNYLLSMQRQVSLGGGEHQREGKPNSSTKCTTFSNGSGKKGNEWSRSHLPICEESPTDYINWA